MPQARFHVSIDIQAPPEEVFDYISDFSKHYEWAANSLSIEPISDGSTGVGCRYHSVAEVNGLNIEAEFEVTEYERPFRLGFTGKDSTGKYEHLFILQPFNSGTHLERHVHFDLSTLQWLMFHVLLYTVRIPAGKKSLALLKECLEKGRNFTGQ